jgi:hypothetical protein
MMLRTLRKRAAVWPMIDKRRARPRPAASPRSLRRDSDGSLYDLTEHRQATLEELRDGLRSGRRFRVHRHDTGADCTYEVLVDVLTAALPAWTLPAKGKVEAALDMFWKGVSGMLVRRDEERPEL